MGVRHSLAQIEGISALFIAGSSASDGTASNLISPLGQAGDVAVTKTGTGTYTVVVKDFKGPLGKVVAMVCLGANSGILQQSVSYSGTTLTLAVSSFAVDGTTATDKSFSFEIWAC